MIETFAYQSEAEAVLKKAKLVHPFAEIIAVQGHRFCEVVENDLREEPGYPKIVFIIFSKWMLIKESA